MRVIFLNSWFALAGTPFFEFIREESENTEIFCLTEISPDIFKKLTLLLKNF
jgi:hypothetical protein